MIELINTNVIDVPIGQSIPFNETVVKSGCAEFHRRGSANLTLVKPGRYLVGFSANIAVPAGEAVGEISFGIAMDGEIIAGSIMRVTPAAVDEFFNIATQHYIDVPSCCGNSCCVNVSVLNNSDIPVTVDNANITAVRVC